MESRKISAGRNPKSENIFIKHKENTFQKIQYYLFYTFLYHVRLNLDSFLKIQ